MVSSKACKIKSAASPRHERLVLRTGPEVLNSRRPLAPQEYATVSSNLEGVGMADAIFSILTGVKRARQERLSRVMVATANNHIERTPKARSDMIFRQENATEGRPASSPMGSNNPHGISDNNSASNLRPPPKPHVTRKPSRRLMALHLFNLHGSSWLTQRTNLFLYVRVRLLVTYTRVKHLLSRMLMI